MQNPIRCENSFSAVELDVITHFFTSLSLSDFKYTNSVNPVCYFSNFLSSFSGYQWKLMSEEDKRPFIDEAKRIRQAEA
jgi:hypothetical protein